MPELPEVETIRRQLAPKVAGRRIVAVEIGLPRLIKYPDAESFRRLLEGQTILQLERRGKYLLFRLEGGRLLIVHLRMTGRLFYQAADELQDKFTHVVFKLDNGFELRYADSRTLGTLDLVTESELPQIKGLHAMGPEPLTAAFDLAYFSELLSKRKGKVKALLLDQRWIGGLGNIYVDESLALAGIHPERQANSLNKDEVNRLYQAVNTVIKEGIEHGGTTFRDYVDGEGKIGHHQQHLRVYGRRKQPCTVCGTAIERLEVAGRGSYFCPNCQRPRP
jgi:formamidopyrimidine-DNA glycosylase